MLPKSLKLPVLILWALAMLAGLFGVVARMLNGHQDAAYGSYVVWGLWVSSYIFFVGLSAGAFLFSSLIYVFQIRQLEKIGKLALFTALATLAMGLLSIWFDLGHMFRAYKVMTSPNFGSMMAWMVWLYSAYSLVVALELWLAIRPDLARWTAESGWRGTVGRLLAFHQGPLSAEGEREGAFRLKVLATAGVPLALAFSGGVGALFGTLSARPHWHTPLMPFLFLTGALVSGGALVCFLAAILWPKQDAEHAGIIKYLSRWILGLLLFDVVLEWAEFSIPIWYGVGPGYDLIMRVLFGHFWWVFWILHVGLGTLLPLWLLVRHPDNVRKVALACFLIATTFMTVRLNIVIPGLVESNLHGLERAFQDSRLTFTYVPSLFEWQITLFILAVGGLLYYAGCRYLPLFENPPAGREAAA